MKRAMIALLIGGAACTGEPPPSPPARAVAPPQTSPMAPKVRGGVDAASQRKREEIISGLTKAGVFYKVDRSGRTPMLWVGPAFQDLPFDDKRNFAGLVLDYAFIENPEHVAIGLVDWRTGNVIGRMDGLYGLTLK